MKVKKLTKKIHDEFPKVWWKLKEYLDTTERPFPCHVGFAEEPIIKLYCHPAPLIFSMLYGLLEDYFEENGIIINIMLCKSGQGYISGRYELFNKKLSMLYNLTIVKGSKQEAKEQAVLKAAEILEERL